MLRPENLPDHSFIIKGKVGRGRRTLSFLSRRHASIISSSSRQSGEFSASYMVRLGSQSIIFLCEQRACPGNHYLTELTEQDMGLMPHVLCFCCLVLLLNKLLGLVVKQSCFLAQSLTYRGLPYLFQLQSPSEINYLITYFVPVLYPCYCENCELGFIWGKMRTIARRQRFRYL